MHDSKTPDGAPDGFPGEQYTKLRQAALLDRAEYGSLHLRGADRVDFLQRMSTNNIAALHPGDAAVTVLTSATARIRFVFTVLCRADDLILLPAGPREAPNLAKFLRSQIFFMDKVTVHPGREKSEAETPDITGQTRLRLVGEDAARQLAAQFEATADLSDGHFVEVDDLSILRQDQLDIPGYELLIPASQLQTFVTDWQAAGVPLLEEDEAYTARRIEWGRPATHAELTDEYNPLEVGLAWTCAENKGCYTGQEIIARQITYDKVTRSLLGLRSEQPLPVGASLHAGARSVGTITSAAYSPTLKSYVALAVVRRPHNVPGESLTLVAPEGEDDVTAAASIHLEALPFAGAAETTPTGTTATLHAEKRV